MDSAYYFWSNTVFFFYLRCLNVVVTVIVSVVTHYANDSIGPVI